MPRLRVRLYADDDGAIKVFDDARTKLRELETASRDAESGIRRLNEAVLALNASRAAQSRMTSNTDRDAVAATVDPNAVEGAITAPLSGLRGGGSKRSSLDGDPYSALDISAKRYQSVVLDLITKHELFAERLNVLGTRGAQNMLRIADSTDAAIGKINALTDKLVNMQGTIVLRVEGQIYNLTEQARRNGAR